MNLCSYCGFHDEKQASLRGDEHKTVQRTEKKLFQQRRSLSDLAVLRFTLSWFWSSPVTDISTPTSALEPTQISLCCGINKISFQSMKAIFIFSVRCWKNPSLFLCICATLSLSLWLFQSVCVIKCKDQNDINDMPVTCLTHFSTFSRISQAHCSLNQTAVTVREGLSFCLVYENNEKLIHYFSNLSPRSWL